MVHSPDTEAARAMQVIRPDEIRSPGVRLYPKACAAFWTRGGACDTQAPRKPSTKNTPVACLGNGIRQKVRCTPRVPAKGGDGRKHGGTPSRRDKYVTPAAISPPGAARG